MTEKFPPSHPEDQQQSPSEEKITDSTNIVDCFQEYLDSISTKEGREIQNDKRKQILEILFPQVFLDKISNENEYKISTANSLNKFEVVLTFTTPAGEQVHISLAVKKSGQNTIDVVDERKNLFQAVKIHNLPGTFEGARNKVEEIVDDLFSEK